MPEPIAPILDAPALFQASGPVAMLGWLALILLPRSVRWRRAFPGTLAPLLLAAAYAGLIASGWSRNDGGFDSFASVRRLFTSDVLLLAGWLHYLAFDLLIGVSIDERAERAGISRLATIPAFCFTFLFGPVGWMLYRVQEWATWRTREGSAAADSRRQVDAVPQAGTPASGGWIGLLRWAWVHADGRLLALAGCILALVPATVVAMLVDDRTLDGAGIWAKPLKFELSLVIYSVTLAMMMPLAGTGFARSLAARWLVGIMASGSAIELAWIILQAARGERSHFNEQSFFGQVMYGVMGVFAVAFVLVPIPLARWAWRERTGGLRAGIVAAVALNLLLGGVAGGWLSTMKSHFIGGDGTDASGLPILGWSTTGGDLRIAHFVGLHAMQAMLLMGIVTARSRPEVGARLVLLAAGAWSVMSGWLFWMALRGLPVF
ncbi:MAG: DUF4281 domain-containing protein [Phycisphaerales bacterium]|nr:DUF4281 domain-containing protein [Phycisphaerales bacterium]